VAAKSLSFFTSKIIHYKPEDHLIVSNHIQAIKKFHYIVSYDDTPEIRNLYSSLRQKRYSFAHNIINSRRGNEILFFDSKLKIDSLEEKNPVGFKRLKKNSNQIVYREPKSKSEELQNI